MKEECVHEGPPSCMHSFWNTKERGRFRCVRSRCWRRTTAREEEDGDKLWSLSRDLTGSVTVTVTACKTHTHGRTEQFLRGCSLTRRIPKNPSSPTSHHTGGRGVSKLNNEFLKSGLNCCFFFSPPGCDKRRSCLAPPPSCHTAITASTHQRQGLARTLLGRLCLFLRSVHVGFYVAVGLEGGGRVEGEILGLGQNAASGGEEEEEEELARFQPQKASFRNAAHLRVNKNFFGVV